MVCIPLLFVSLFSVDAIYISDVEKDETLIVENLKKELEAQDINVEYELNKTVKELKLQLLAEQDLNEIEKINNLIFGAEKLLDEYIRSKNGASTYANPPNSAVPIVVAYFSNKNYVLARELLLQATLNSNKSSTYIPTHGSIIKNTQVIRSIANGGITSGSSIFSSTSTVQEADCKYALHKFNFSKATPSMKTVKVTDYYDYESGDYDGLEGLAVDAMANAQKNGSLVPYHVSITVTV